jgi:hypothetical protein
MRYPGFLTAGSESGYAREPEHIQQEEEPMEGTRASVLVASDGLKPSWKEKRVRPRGGKTTVTDGPFTESKELVS